MNKIMFIVYHTKFKSIKITFFVIENTIHSQFQINVDKLMMIHGSSLNEAQSKF